jgi:Protein of unknown function (DUF1266)
MFGVFKFIKETIVDGLKEGVAEAKAEMAADALKADTASVNKKAYALELAQKHQALSPEEIFVVALGAPYREVFIADLSDAKSENRPAYYLCSMDVPQDQAQELKKYLERDFDVTDQASLMHMTMQTQALIYSSLVLDCGQVAVDSLEELAELDSALAAHVTALLSAIEDNQASSWASLLLTSQDWISKSQLHNATTDQKAKIALWMARLAYATTLSAGLGYISKSQALKLMKFLVQTGLPVISNWQDFAELYLAGEKLDGTNNMLGRKVLSIKVQTLLKDPLSPWVTHPWLASWNA